MPLVASINVHAPWNDDQVRNLNDVLKEKRIDAPFTDEFGKPLVATNYGWCRQGETEIILDWAWDWMLDGRWREWLGEV